MPLEEHLDLSHFHDVSQQAAALNIYADLAKLRSRYIAGNTELQKTLSINKDMTVMSKPSGQAQELYELRNKVQQQEEQIRQLEQEKGDLQGFVKALQAQQAFYQNEKTQIDQLIAERDLYAKRADELGAGRSDDAYEELQLENKKLRLLVQKMLSDEDFVQKAISTVE